MQSNLDGRPAMLEQLSDWLLHGRDQIMWRELFIAQNHGGIAFGRQTATLLCADCPATWTPEDVEAHCVTAGGHSQPSRPGDLLSFFDTPVAALQVALELQRTHRTHPLRLSMATACFTYAEVHGTSGVSRIYFGSSVARQERSILSCVPGTLLLCAESYRALHQVLPAKVPDGVIATELIDDVVTLASVTLPPPRSAHLSTFAGLGLV